MKILNGLNECILTCVLNFRLRYLDLSTIPYRGLLMQRNRAVTAVCDHLVQTPRRFFFDPMGITRMFCQMDFSLNSDFHNKVMTSLRTEFVDIFLELVRSLWPSLHQSYSHIESRVDKKGNEISFNFYNVRKIPILSMFNATLNFASFT